MGNCYSTDHIAEAHIHTDITCNMRNHNRSTALERSVIDHYVILYKPGQTRPGQEGIGISTCQWKLLKVFAFMST